MTREGSVDVNQVQFIIGQVGHGLPYAASQLVEMNLKIVD